MSLNRYRIPGSLILEVRHTSDGKPWLSKLTREQIAYCLGYASNDTGTVVHAAFVHGDVAAVLATDTSGMFSVFTQRLHTALTELVNHGEGRERGTIWDNRKPHESLVQGWFPALFAIGLLAIRAADEARSTDPHDCEGYFGPRSWGTIRKVARPDGFNARSARPPNVWLNAKVPDCASRGFYLEELIADADFEANAFIAEAQGHVLRTRRPGHRTYAGRPKLSTLPGLIGEQEAMDLLAAELESWRAYYQRCRREFTDDQHVVFPAGTDRFRALGAAVAPCRTYVAPLQPHRLHPPRPPPG